jgi:O-antigen ligase
MTYTTVRTPLNLPYSSRAEIAGGGTSVFLLMTLFGLFALYGPSFNVAGQLRYVEAALLIIGIFSFNKFQSRVDRLEWKLCTFFIFTAAIQAVANFVNDAPGESTIARVGTYLVLAALIPILAVIINRDQRRLTAVILGYCLSYIFVVYEGSMNNENYVIVPWRLGLGFAATLAAVMLISRFAKLTKFAPAIFLGLTILHIYLESRSLAAVTAILSIFTIASYFWPRNVPAKFKLSSLIALLLGFVLLIALGLQSFNWLADLKLLPEGIIQKNEIQSSNSYGYLAAARPDTVTAIYAISQRPILGYGSGVFDPQVFSFYAEVNAASYQDLHISRNIYYHILKQDWTFGIPSHSHIFGAWADAGIFAALSWIYVLSLVIIVLVRVWRWNDAYALLYAFVSTMTIWDVVLSPGPTRLDIALRLIIIVMAFRSFSDFDGRTGTAFRFRRSVK